MKAITYESLHGKLFIEVPVKLLNTLKPNKFKPKHVPLFIAKTAIAIIWVLLCGCNASSTSENAQNSASAAEPQFSMGNAAPDFTLPDMDGNMVSLRSMKGKFVVIHFATTWCPFCNAEAPHLEELYQTYKSKDVEVLIIDVKEPKELVAEKLRDRFNLTFPILLDNDGMVSTRFAPPDALPDLARDEVMLASNLLIDPNGQIQFMSLLDSKNFDAKLVALQKRLNELLSARDKMTVSNEIVKLKGPVFISMNAGEQSTLTVSFQIRDGFHIQANKVNDDSLIPVELKMNEQEGISFGETVFPDWKEFNLKGTEDKLWVFDEIVDVKIPLSVAKNKGPGYYLLHGNLYYQACDSWKCLFPRQLEFELCVKIV